MLVQWPIILVMLLRKFIQISFQEIFCEEKNHRAKIHAKYSFEKIVILEK
jgi:hypothetical protein